MKKLIFILLLIAITTGIKAQFAGVLTDDVFTFLVNDSALLSPPGNTRGIFQWQKSTDSSNWTNIDANLTGDTLTFVPEATEAYRLEITDGTCSPIYSDTIKVFSKNTYVPEYQSAGVTVLDLFDAGVMVGRLEQSGADSLDLANAGLIGIRERMYFY